MQGELLEPDDAGYDESRQVWNAMVDKRPALIARCSGTDDVVSALAIAGARELEVSIRGGGHSIVGHSVTEGGLMIDLSAMNDVRVDPDARRVTVGGGALWADIDRASLPLGLAVTGGMVSHTGVGGLTLGGGYGWLARRHGLSCDNLLSAQVVTAAGEIVTASEEENEDLLWGLRGGGGNFGVVSEFVFRLHDFDGQCLSVDLIYAAEDGGEVLHAFAEFAAAAPDDVTAVAHIGAARSSPFLAERWHGRPVVVVSCVYLGDEDAGLRLVEPVRTAARPVAEIIEALPYLMLQAQIDASQEHGMRRYWKGHFIRELGGEAIEAFLLEGLAAAETSSACGGDLISLGGAISRVGEDDTAFGRRDTAFDFLAAAGWEDPAEDEFQMTTARKFAEGMSTFGYGVYVNSLTNEGEERVRSAYGSDKFARLVALKDTYDPENVFHLNQNIRPSALHP